MIWNVVIAGFIIVSLLFVEFIRRNDLWRLPTTHFTNMQFFTHIVLCLVWSLLAMTLFIKFILVPITQPEGTRPTTKPAPTTWHVPLAPD